MEMKSRIMSWMRTVARMEEKRQTNFEGRDNVEDLDVYRYETLK
jgi:hypothetical protein